MADGHCFISYSAADGLDFATKLADELQGRHPNIKVWFDKREMDASIVDWDDQLANAIKACKCLVFVMTPDSTAKGSTCKEEWTWALKYKKPVICLLKDKKAEVPFRLNNRQYIDVSTDFDSGIAQLRTAIGRLDEPEGILEELDRRLSQAKRDLQRTPREEEKPRIQAEIEELNKQIEVQQKIVTNPKKAEEQTQKNIETGLERERKPEKPVAGKTSTRFINPPPGIAPNYFQDRYDEIKEIKKFLENDAQRLLTIVGRAGVGKTAMVCRLLKTLERGELPDDLGEMKVDGIVYLSETGSHRVNFANVFADLSKLLSKDDAERLEGIYKNPQTSTGDKMRALLDAFPSGRVILLLDNFETLVDPESLSLRDSELSDALNALLGGQHHAVKAVITTRIAPRDLAVSEPGRQHHLSLDEGLESPYAENVLREMDADGRVGLKSAPDALLNKAREKTRGYPRALEALYAILSVDRYTTLEELLELSLPDEVVQKLVGEAFNRLDPSAQKVMQALAVYNRPVSPAAIDYLLQPHLPSIDSAPILQRLANMHFARKESGRFYLHPLDREFAFGLISEELTTKYMKDAKELRNASKLLLSNEAMLQQTQRKEKKNFFEKLLVLLLDFATRGARITRFKASRFTGFTTYDLQQRSADYFAKARKSRAEWRKLEDIATHLAEFDLRCAAGDYDTAAYVLMEVDIDYLLLLGHFQLLVQMHERLQGKIKDPSLKVGNIGNLGSAHFSMGQYEKAIIYYEQSLLLAREHKNLYSEGAALGNLGNAYANLGNEYKAIEFHKQAISISQKIGNRKGEGNDLTNLGNRYVELGDIHTAIEFYKKSLLICREIGNKVGEGAILGNLGSTYILLGDTHKATEFYEKSLLINREIGNRVGEGSNIGNLGDVYNSLGNTHKAIELFKQAFSIHREVDNHRSESIILESIGNALLNLEEHEQAKTNFQQAIQVADEISFPQTQNNARCGLAQAYLLQNDLVNARATIEAALQYDVPQCNHDVSALYGIIALRQGESATAREAFAKSIAQADEILVKTPDYYSALDAKGLALSGLALCEVGEDDGQRTVDDGQSSIVYRQRAIESFKQARKIAPHAGVVKSVLRLFDELVKCDEEGVLKDVRKVIEGA